VQIHFYVRRAEAKMRLRLNIDERRRQANKNISAAVISVIDTRSINCESSLSPTSFLVTLAGGDDENIISVLLLLRQEIGRKR
jgi:hypothetical protein